jgi:membrane-bound lytic murein transglycosylase B
MRIYLPFLAVLFLSFPAFAQEEPQKVYTQAGLDAWVVTFRDEARAAGISEATLNAALSDVELQEKAIKLDQKQPDKAISFVQYKKNVLPQKRIDLARKLYKENKALLERIGKEYKVQPRFIVALWGVESNFGQNMGGFSVINALATLAYEGRREEFFKEELLNALKIIDAGHISAEDMRGSWAGAMGQTQFMPSSFLTRAVDYDGDGKKDIWGTKADVFASIANYLSQEGWNDELTWGRKVEVPKGFDMTLISSKLQKPIIEWKKLGVKKLGGGNLPVAPVEASVVRPDDNGQELYIVYPNYMKILKWNRSLYFATTVGLFSDLIGRG